MSIAEAEIKKLTLYEVGERLQELDDFLGAIGGDVTDDQVAEMIDTYLTDLTEQRDRKLDNYGKLIREKQARAKALSDEADRLSSQALIEQSGIDRLKERLKNFFIVNGIEKPIKTDHFTFRLQNNGGVLPLIVDCAAEEMPEEYHVRTITANNKLIRENLDAGEELEFARYGERGKQIRIS